MHDRKGRHVHIQLSHAYKCWLGSSFERFVLTVVPSVHLSYVSFKVRPPSVSSCRWFVACGCAITYIYR